MRVECISWRKDGTATEKSRSGGKSTHLTAPTPRNQADIPATIIEGIDLATVEHTLS